MVDGTWDKKRGVTKMKEIRRSVELSRCHHLDTREWTGPAGGLPFPVIPNGSGPNIFLSLFGASRTRSGRMKKTSNKAALWV